MSQLVSNAPEHGRRRIHSRRICIDGYVRADGMMELEARLEDTKSHDYPISTGVVRAGEAVHDLFVVLVVDEHFVVQDITTRLDAMPYPGACDAIAPAYRSLIGLSLVRGFRQAVRMRLEGVSGCSHLTELLMSVPTVALQTMASFRRDNEDTVEKPFQLDKCHALDTGGEVVRQYYPKWYIKR